MHTTRTKHARQVHTARITTLLTPPPPRPPPRARAPRITDPAFVTLVDVTATAAPPTAGVSEVTFLDVDLDTGYISGTIDWKHATDSTDFVTQHMLFLSTDTMGADKVIACAPVAADATSAMIDPTTLELAGRVYTHILVYPSNDGGLSNGYGVIEIHDRVDVQVTGLKLRKH